MAEVDIGKLTKTIVDIGYISKDVVVSTQNLKTVVTEFGKEFDKDSRRTARTVKDLANSFEKVVKNLTDKIEHSEKTTEEDQKQLNKEFNNLNSALFTLIKAIGKSNAPKPQNIESVERLSKTLTASFSDLSKKLLEQSKQKTVIPIEKPKIVQQPTQQSTIKPVVNPVDNSGIENKEIIVENSENEKSWWTKLYEKYLGASSENSKSKETLLDGIEHTISFQQRELIKGAEGIIYGSLTHTKYGGVGKQAEAKNFIQSVLDAIEEHKKNTGSKFDELPKEELLRLIRTNTELNEHQKRYLENHFFERKKEKQNKEPKEDIGIIRKLLMLTPFLISVFSGMSLPVMISTIVAGTFAAIIGGPYLMKVVSAYLKDSLLAKVVGEFAKSGILKKVLGSASEEVVEGVVGSGGKRNIFRGLVSKGKGLLGKSKGLLAGAASSTKGIAGRVLPSIGRGALTGIGGIAEIGSMVGPAVAAAAVPVAVGGAVLGAGYITSEVAKLQSQRKVQNESVVGTIVSQATLMAKKAKTPEDFKKIDKLLKEESQRQQALDKGAGFFGGDLDVGKKASYELLKYNEQLQKNSLQILKKNAEKMEVPKTDMKESTEKMITATEKTTKVFEGGISKLDQTMNKVVDLIETLKVNNTIINNTQNNNKVDLGISYNRPSMLVAQA